MNSQTSNLPDSSPIDAGSEVLKLACPFCSGILNLRRIHIGIEGACVYCEKPVTALEDESGCRLVSSIGIPDSPFPESQSVVEHEDVFQSFDIEAPVQVDENSQIIADGFPSLPDESDESSGSPWGFPEKKKADEGPLNQLSAIPLNQSQSEPEVPFPDTVAISDPGAAAEDSPFQSRPEEEEPFQSPETPVAKVDEPSDMPPPLSTLETPEPFAPAEDTGNLFASPDPVPELTPVEDSVMDIPSQLVDEPEATPFPSSETPPPLEKTEEPVASSPPPLAPALEVASEERPPPFEDPFAKSEGAEKSEPMSAQPLPGGISPFSTGSAKRVEPGFAETLFTEQSEPEPAPIVQAGPVPPDMSAPDDVAANAANQWGPPASAKTSDGEELDFSAVVAPPSKSDESDAAAPTTAKLPEKRKSGASFLKKIFKFFLTIGLIGGIIFAAQTFVPAEKWTGWKQQAIDWLEPGSVLLEKLPFGKNRNAAPVSPVPVKPTKPATQTRQQISEELLSIPQRQPGM